MFLPRCPRRNMRFNARPKGRKPGHFSSKKIQSIVGKIVTSRRQYFATGPVIVFSGLFDNPDIRKSDGYKNRIGNLEKYLEVAVLASFMNADTSLPAMLWNQNNATPEGGPGASYIECVVYGVVAICGYREHSAVDPVHDVVELRSKFEKGGFSFTFTPMQHGTRMWASILRLGVNTVHAQTTLCCGRSRLGDDRHTVPHPAGALCYPNEQLRHLVKMSAPYINTNGVAHENMGTFPLQERWAISPWWWLSLSHLVIGLNPASYVALLGEAMFNSVKTVMWRAKREGCSQKWWNVPNKEDPEVLRQVRELGSDLIATYLRATSVPTNGRLFAEQGTTRRIKSSSSRQRLKQSKHKNALTGFKMRLGLDQEDQTFSTHLCHSGCVFQVQDHIFEVWIVYPPILSFFLHPRLEVLPSARRN
ncbi:hypothetical protein EDB19DRAFT_2023370 [Suillus lakei]|nr:hypothetical protein EDB19DRAFT_2023370 [Suillus lakei]